MCISRLNFKFFLQLNLTHFAKLPIFIHDFLKASLLNIRFADVCHLLADFYYNLAVFLVLSVVCVHCSPPFKLLSLNHSGTHTRCACEKMFALAMIPLFNSVKADGSQQQIINV